MPYKDKGAQKAAQRRAMAAARSNQGSQPQGSQPQGSQPQGSQPQGSQPDSVIPDPIPEEYFVDGAGQRRQVDFARRRQDWLQLRAWRRGKGTANQYNMGKLAAVYGKLHGEFDKPDNLARYLGCSEGTARKLLARTG